MYRSLPMAWMAAGPKAAVHYSWLTLYMNYFVPSGSMRCAIPTAVLRAARRVTVP
jgi:hypothetical protein